MTNPLKNPKSKGLKIIVSALFVLLILVLILAYTLFAPNYQTRQGDNFYLKIRDNATIEQVMDSLQKGGKMNLSSFKTLSGIVKWKPRSGQFKIKNGISNIMLIKLLRSGEQSPVRLTFNNLRTREQLAARMSRSLMCDSLELLLLMRDTNYLAGFGFTPETAICNFLPNTYELYWNTDAKKLFERMNKEYRKFWNKERTEQAEKMGLNPDQICTLASIVEEESNSRKERPIIAGLYLNRLRTGMPLQADPTVKFALGDFELKRIRSKHTSFDSPYNTYMYEGLPPGPIRMASSEGIDAVLNFEPNNYLFMCAKETLNGEHNFASNMQEHLRNARKYQRALNALNILQ